MIILIGMWLCILYCVIRYIIKLGRTIALIFFSFIIFTSFTLIGSDAGHIGLGMSIGIIFILFGIACVFEGEKRVKEENRTNKEIYTQNKYDDDLGFNDFNR